MAEEKEEDVVIPDIVNPDAVEDLLEVDWKDEDEEGDKLFGDEEEEGL